MPIDLNDIPELWENNPYSIGSVFVFDEGDILLDGADPIIPRNTKDKYYTVKMGDDLSSISFGVYEDSKWWWLIAKVNNIPFGFELPLGKTLTIPELSQAQLEL
jgi:nucleoid-associated protein YgaU